MIALYYIGLLIQISCLIFVLSQFRLKILGFPGALFICISTAYHGVTEILQHIFPGFNYYREYISKESLYLWVLYISIAILFFTIIYFNRVKKIINLSITEPKLNKLLPIAYILLPFTAIAYFLNIEQFKSFSIYLYWLGGLLGLNMLILLSLNLSLFANKYKYLYLPFLFILAGLLFLVSQRLTLVTGLAMYLGVLNIFGKKYKIWEIAIFVGLSVLLMMFLTILRDTFGRDILTGESTERISAIQRADIGLKYSRDNRTVLLEQFVYRFDGNSFASLIVEGINEQNYPLLYHKTLVANYNLAVPRFLNPNKPEVTDLSSLSLVREENLIVEHYDLFFMDYLPTIAGIFVAAGNWWLLIIMFCVLGYLFSSFDLLLRRKRNIFFIILYLSLIHCVFFYEQAVEIYIQNFRSLIFLIPFIYILTTVSKAFYSNKR